MAVTITPQKFPPDPSDRAGGGSSISHNLTEAFTQGNDPAYIEVPSLPVLVNMHRDEATNVRINVTRYNKLKEPPYTLGGTGFPSIEFSGFTTPFVFMIREELSEAIIDRTKSPPRIRLSAQSFTKVQISAFEIDYPEWLQ